MSFTTVIRVQVGDSIREYPQDIAGYGEHIAEGGTTVSIHVAIGQAHEFFRAHRDETWKAITFWVWMDDSGVAYHVEVNRYGTHRVIGAAPMPGRDNVRDVYVA